MAKYETILSMSGHPVNRSRNFVESIGRVFIGLGVVCAVLGASTLAMLLSSAELRDRVFLSEPDLGLAMPSSVPVNSNKKVSVKHLDSSDSIKPLTGGQRQITTYLAKRYSVSPEAVELLVRLAYKVGKEEKVEPTLILAIVGIESSYNPFAASPVGARGLMQVMPHIHDDKFEALSPGDWSHLNPEMNMRVGAKIIREYTRRTGSVSDGLSWYVGAAVHGNDGGYPGKVLGLKARIDAAYLQGKLLAKSEGSQKVSVAPLAGKEG